MDDDSRCSSSVSKCVSMCPDELQLEEENVDLTNQIVTIKEEEEEVKQNDDGLRVQICNLFCYQCQQLFPDSHNFHNHIQSFHQHNQNQNERGNPNPILKPGKKYKCKTRLNSKEKTIKSKTQRISSILRNTNSNSFNTDKVNEEEEYFCLEGQDRILVECKKCRKDFTSLSQFLKHLKRKKRILNKKVHNSQQHPSFNSQQQLLLLAPENRENEIRTETKEEQEQNFDSQAQVDNENELEDNQGEESDDDEWNPEPESDLDCKNKFNRNKRQRSSKGPKKVVRKRAGVSNKIHFGAQYTQSTQDLNENYRHQDEQPPPEENENEDSSSTSISIPRSSSSTSTARQSQRQINGGKKTQILKCCDMCNFSARFKKQLRLHKREMHQGQKFFMCHLCSEFFKSEGYLQRHMRQAHEKFKDLQCSECGKCFGELNSLKAHMTVHRDVRPFLCPESKCRFSTFGFKLKSNLNAHFVAVHKPTDQLFQCSQCPKMFKTKPQLRQHMRVHSDRSKNFVCAHPGCGKAYFKATHLNLHRKASHFSADDEKFHCPICYKAFTRNEVMKTHVKIVHHKIKKFICDQCGKSFGKSHALTVHQRSHSGVRLFSCLLCPKSFTTKQQLVNHSSKCHPDPLEDDKGDAECRNSVDSDSRNHKFVLIKSTTTTTKQQ